MGTWNEYGDTFNTMGSWNFGFYAASQQANSLHWLDAGTNYQTVETSGTYTLQPYEARPAGLKALRVRRGTGNNAFLWIEAHQSQAPYSSQLNPAVFNGALLRYEDDFTGSSSNLLDFTPATDTFNDAVLAVGRTWMDPYSNVSITVNSMSSSGMAVTVNYGATTCTPVAPSVTLSPIAASAEQGGTAFISAVVRNNNAQVCGGETFALSTAAPGSWSADLVASSVTVLPGQQVQTTLSVKVPAGYALGTYPVSVTARGDTSALPATANANVTVTEPAGATCQVMNPTLTMSPAKATVDYGASTRVTIGIHNNDSSACPAESLSVSANGPTSWSYALKTGTVSIASGADGQVALDIGVPDGFAEGTYPVAVSVRNVDGTINASGTVAVDVVKPACAPGAPLVTMSPADVTLEPGRAMQLSVTIRNTSASTCGAEAFNLGAKVPSGWSDAFGGDSVSLSPGQEARFTFSVAVPQAADPGAYAVQASVNSAASGLSAQAVSSVTVMKPEPPPCTTGTPSLSVSPASASVTAGSTVQLVLTAGNTNSASCAAEAYGVGASVPSGWSQALGSAALTMASGAQGSTTLTVQVPSSQAPGTFQIGAGVTGARSGLTTTQAVSVTVEVPAATPTPTPAPSPAPTPPVTPEKPVTSTGQPVALSIYVVKKNKGSVSVSETGQYCTKKCAFSFAQSSATTVTLTASSSGRFAFAGWSGACSGSEPTCVVTMDAAKSVTAQFVKVKKL
ncbi:MAG: hypothetical protein FIB04_08470, partial [Gammaproteobacteria bacterium]|nr:hypothetical protein [Gammaproteobacteria bacterium]